jgi:hypothetical protein
MAKKARQRISYGLFIFVFSCLGLAANPAAALSAARQWTALSG